MQAKLTYPSMAAFLKAYRRNPYSVHFGPSVGGAAASLGVSRARIWNLINEEKLAASVIYEDGEVAYCFVSEEALKDMAKQRSKSQRVEYAKAMKQREST